MLFNNRKSEILTYIHEASINPRLSKLRYSDKWCALYCELLKVALPWFLCANWESWYFSGSHLKNSFAIVYEVFALFSLIDKFQIHCCRLKKEFRYCFEIAYYQRYCIKKQKQGNWFTSYLLKSRVCSLTEAKT